jgi:hypothetical protein
MYQDPHVHIRHDPIKKTCSPLLLEKRFLSTHGLFQEKKCKAKTHQLMDHIRTYDLLVRKVLQFFLQRKCMV